MWGAAMVALAALVTGCGSSSSPSSSGSAASGPASPTGSAPPRTADGTTSEAGPAALLAIHIPTTLEDLVVCRREYAPRIEVEPTMSTAPRPFTLTAALAAQQSLVAAIVDGARAVGSAGPLPGGAGLGQETPGARFLNLSRLLRADAVRAFEERDDEGAVARLEASFRIGGYLMAQDDHDLRFRGGQVVTPTMFDLDALRKAGFVDRLDAAAAGRLAAAIQAIDLSRNIVPWDPSTAAGKAFTAIVAALEARSHR